VIDEDEDEEELEEPRDGIDGVAELLV